MKRYKDLLYTLPFLLLGLALYFLSDDRTFHFYLAVAIALWVAIDLILFVMKKWTLSKAICKLISFLWEGISLFE